MVGGNADERFDLVVSNPDFEVALQFIYVALMALKSHPDASMWGMLLNRAYV